MENRTYGPLTLPNGNEIKFRTPTGKDRVDVIRMTQVKEDNLLGAGMLIDQYVKAKVIIEINGNKIDDDYRHIMDDWSLEDVDFYGAVYNELFGETEERKAKVKEVAGFLRDN